MPRSVITFLKMFSTLISVPCAKHLFMLFVLNQIFPYGIAAKIGFWEHSNFNGNSFSVNVNGRGCFNVPASWNDRISSVHVQAVCIMVWEHSNCRGRALKIHGNHKHLGASGFNDVISSFQLCPTSTEGGGGGGGDSGIARASLDAHNKYRRLHGAPDLKWDRNLQAAAQRHADYLAKNNQFHHSKNGNGENLAGTGGRTKEEAITQAVRMWYNEVKHYNFNRPGFNMNTGHFTQVVWKSSSRLGVGVAWNRARNWWIVCANYSPPGNVVGHFPQNVERRRV